MKAISLVLCALLLSAGLTTPAEAATKFKVAVVNVQQAINQSKEGKKATAYFQNKLRAKEKDFRAKGMEIKKKDEQLQASMMLSEEARQKKQSELNRLKKSLQEAVQKAQGAYRQEERKQLQRISQEVLMAVRKIGERDKYDLVMEAALRQTLLYTPSEITNITDEVVKEYNKMKTGGK